MLSKISLATAIAAILFFHHQLRIDTPIITSSNSISKEDDNDRFIRGHYCEHQFQSNEWLGFETILRSSQSKSSILQDKITDSECYQLLRPALQFKPAWIFLGDSQMMHLVKNMKYPHEIHHTRLPKNEDNILTWGRCDALNYYYLQRSETWMPPAVLGGDENNNDDNNRNAPIQGPAKYGLEHHYCQDASGPYNRRFATKDDTIFMEYLAVEFASDVEHQSTITNTTQESAVHYLKEEQEDMFMIKNEFVCVVNVGIHDQKLCPGLRHEDVCLQVYISNVKSYLALLNTVCGTIVWLSITSVRGDRGYAQLNSRSLIWNGRVKEMLAREYPNNSYFVDVWNASLRGTRNSNIHFEPEYYVGLASLFSSLM